MYDRCSEILGSIERGDQVCGMICTKCKWTDVDRVCSDRAFVAREYGEVSNIVLKEREKKNVCVGRKCSSRSDRMYVRASCSCRACLVSVSV